MKILITGGAGFLGQRLARQLLEQGTLTLDASGPQTITRIDLLDVVKTDAFTDPRVHSRVGDIADPAVLRDAIDTDTRAIFHLAAIVSGQAEADFDLGMRINLDASRALLDVCRALGHQPRVIFTSSVAVYGGDLPDTVRDDTALCPQSSYGTQKAIAELLLADYTRRGFVDGRVLRLPTISVRPGRPNAAASSFASGIIREPLNGEAAVCPVGPDTRLWLLSPRGAIQALIAGCELPADTVADRAPINLPGVSVTVADMEQALRDVAGDAVADRITWRPDEKVERIVGSWPGRWDTTRANRLGLAGDKSFADIIRAYLADDLPR
ncbi:MULTISPECIES: D-erythronate dehydrogenase [Achromobacter]|uniref:SDR family oxidoreductase n=1 Tax=Achromobacter spanius TaxID=217203 RepID=A0ABY8GNB9_9BURK|nr:MULTISPECIES: D-erythronate dehydrogenase [Achromobacter]WAI84637.1 SDR family oxidoreductase [Achromobacter spanius]WEX94722.1 SDR family oxidoreductase [Achromobacter sp. SS2-2022]WFP06114.1 SDR family oxidoreductase [Achromobacter spanius]